MSYRIYINVSGWELVKITPNEVDMIKFIEHMICKDEDMTIFVIRHNKELDMDEPYFGYYGNIDKFIEFKNNIMPKTRKLK